MLLRFLSQVRRSRGVGESPWPPLLLHGKTGEPGLRNNLSLVIRVRSPSAFVADSPAACVG